MSDDEAFPVDLGPDVTLWLEDHDGGICTYTVPEAIAQMFTRHAAERGEAIARAKIIRHGHPGGWDLSG